MSTTLGALETKVAYILEQNGGDEDLEGVSLRDCIQKAVTQVYSKDRPAEIAVDVAGDGGFDYDLTDVPGYVSGFSNILSVEHPVDDDAQTPNLLEADEWTIYRKPSGLFLRFLETTPDDGETIRLTFTAPYQFSSSASGASVDIPVTDVDAIADLSAGEAFDRLASKFARDSAPTISADSVDRRDKTSKYQSLAKTYRTKYVEHIGKPDGVVAAGGTVDWDPTLQDGLDRLTHPRRNR